MPSLKITQEKKERGLVLHLAGAVALEQVEALKQRLDQALQKETPRIILDLSGCPSLDTAGLAVLVSAFIHARQAGRGFFLVGVNPRIEKLMQVTRLATVFDLRGTVEEALEGRRTPRAEVSVPLRVSWTSSEGKTVEELITTEILNAHGARFRLQTPVELGTQFAVVNLNNQESAQARVVWAGEHSPPDGQRVGIEFLNSRAAFWGTAYSPWPYGQAPR